MRKLKAYFRAIKKKLTNPEDNKKIVSVVTYIVLGVVAIVMTVMNFLTDKGMLIWCTGIFAGFCVLDLVLTFIGPKCAKVASFLLSIEILVMFTFFVVTGNPDGFSAIWICLLPSMGMLFYGRARGSILCLVMEAELIFLLWTPYGNSFLQYAYTGSFLMRFPVLFVAFYLLALFLESITQFTYDEVNRLQEKYKNLSRRDPLTELLNRQGLFEDIENIVKPRKYTSLTAIMFDLDLFKDVNDLYGHEVGDDVLRQFSKMMKRELNAIHCRWGGEEFLSIACDNDVTKEDIERFRKLVSETVFVCGQRKLNITVSIGVSFLRDRLENDDFDRFVRKADYALYDAKNSGRNKVVFF